ncbi:hypothetical protein CK203_040346 [Vitis vinifera]|uniref:Uncharacterized protein n=1 Tax=Vitis vinifera TaxID=29760 RepID=A0A438FX08_VITVI|nr:hypothetical protein CK203_040346 [Vitis vinifera]
MESFLTPRQFYYPRVVIDFYQSMTTRGLRNPTLIQFTIDGRQGAIGARHIAEALRIPYEPVFQADFREWSSFSQSDMVRILSRGTSTASVLTRRELPSGMLLIDRGFLSRKWHHLVAYFAPQAAPTVPAPPELPRDEQIPQAQQDEILTETTPPTPAAHTSVHMPEAIHPSSPITQRLRAFIADTEHCSGFYYPPDGHYSGTPGSDHCYSGPAYHDPSSDSAASEYADPLGMIGLHHPSL